MLASMIDKDFRIETGKVVVNGGELAIYAGSDSRSSRRVMLVYNWLHNRLISRTIRCARPSKSGKAILSLQIKTKTPSHELLRLRDCWETPYQKIYKEFYALQGSIK